MPREPIKAPVGRPRKFCLRCAPQRGHVPAVEYGRAVRLARTQQLRNAYGALQCLDCRQHVPWEAMDFHHRDPADKSFTIGKSASRSWDSVVAEIAKCDLICANCHRIRHAEMRKVA